MAEGATAMPAEEVAASKAEVRALYQKSFQDRRVLTVYA